MKNLLITGITGFLGRNLVKYIAENNLDYNIYGIGNSERKILLLQKYNTKIKIIKLNLESRDFKDKINDIIIKYKITHVVHSAAMKYVDICEENPIETIKINVFASNSIVELCNNHKLKLIALSTDKSNTPFNVYGMSKNIMERIVLNNGFKIYQGANFFGSDGSVIDVWYNQMISNKKLTITDIDSVRYFNDVKYISKILLDNFDNEKQIILPEYVYRISLKTLLSAFSTKFNYHNYEIIGKRYFEKVEETIDPSITNIIELDVDNTIKLLDGFFETNDVNVLK